MIRCASRPFDSRRLPMHRARQRIATWLAIFAMLAAALAPAVSRAALPGEASRYLADLCSASGTGVTRADASRGADFGGAASKRDGESRPLAHALDRCPYCSFHSGASAPPAATGAPLLASPGGAPSARPSFVAPRPRDTWPPAQPRAPPGA